MTIKFRLVRLPDGRRFKITAPKPATGKKEG